MHPLQMLYHRSPVSSRINNSFFIQGFSQDRDLLPLISKNSFAGRSRISLVEGYLDFASIEY
jgi:hypothetical protein